MTEQRVSEQYDSVETEETVTSPEGDATLEETPEVDDAVETPAVEESDEESHDDEAGDVTVDEATGEIVEDAADEESDDADDPLEAFRRELWAKPGDWFVVHTYSGMENRVKSNLENRIISLNMEDYIHEIVVPTEEVAE
ncbi:MAG: transcription termination/antitermination NusG family protein, partial [Nocardioides sp.]